MPLIARQGYERVDSVDAEEDVITEAACNEASPASGAESSPSADNAADSIAVYDAPSVPSSSSGDAQQPDCSPPPYLLDGETIEVNGDDLDPCPPKYDDVVKLPTYEEVELDHTIDLDDDDNELTEDLQNEAARRLEGLSLGTDMHFVFAFFFAFFFHVIGFMLAYCLSTTVAGRFGALSGFGLSLIKTAFLFKYTTLADESTGAWPGFFFAICGMTIFIHGICSYIRAKRAAMATPITHFSSFVWSR